MAFDVFEFAEADAVVVLNINHAGSPIEWLIRTAVYATINL